MIKVLTRAAAAIAVSLSFFISPILAENVINVDGVPLPNNAFTSGIASSPFVGAWIGTWGGMWKTILIVEQVSKTGDANVIYALGDNPRMNFKRSWYRYEAKVTGNILRVQGNGFVVTYYLSKNGRLKAIYNREAGHAVLSKFDLKQLTNTKTKVSWTYGHKIFLKTSLVENGRPIALETIIYKPKGKGPLPLAIVNHGSTGSGNDSAITKITWTNEYFAERLNERGWIVAFPQRRGRGQSEGKYEEGISKDRSKGYTCQIKRSLAGANRALTDIHAAITALRNRSDVSEKPILIAGGFYQLLMQDNFPMKLILSSIL